MIQRNKIAFNDLQFRRYELKALKRNLNHPVHGLDTETLQGYCRLIAMEDGDYYIGDSLDHILEFLSQEKLRVHHNFFYNVRFDFQAIIKYLPEKKLIELYNTSKTVYKDYQIKYIPKKLFRIVHKKHSYRYYDLAQFYEMSLAKAAKKYLNEHKNKENINATRLNLDLNYWNKREKDIIKYCISDASLCHRLGVFLQSELKSKLAFTPQKYISKASISKEYFRKRCVIPSLKYVPKCALSYAFNSYKGGRFEVLKKGCFEDTTLIDINSAYPYHISNLADFTGAEWKRVHEVDYDSTYGFYLCKVFIPYMEIAPIAYNLPSHKLIFPIGEFTTYLTLQEIKAYENICSIGIISGVECKIENDVYPFRKEIFKLYEWKQNTPKKDFRYDLVKKIMNSLYGVFYEKIKQGDKYRVGTFFNPIYAAVITANTRVQLFSEAMKHEKDVIGFATDSVLLKGAHEYNGGKRLGAWDIDSSGKAVVLRSGLYQIEEKVKSRGISKAKNIKTPYGEFKNIFEYVKQYPYKTKYKVLLDRPLNLGEALLHPKKGGVANINVWQDFEYTLNINRDVKRIWDSEFKEGGEIFERCIDSEAQIAGEIFEEANIEGVNRKIMQRERALADEALFHDIGKDLDSRMKKKAEREEEVLGEMKRDMRQEAMAMIWGR